MKVERSLPDGLDTGDMEINELMDVHREHADEEQAEDNDLEDGEMDGGGYDEDWCKLASYVDGSTLYAFSFSQLIFLRSSKWRVL